MGQHIYPYTGTRAQHSQPQGGFYSAEDADSEGIEGKYYVWTEDELQKVLSPDEYASLKKDFHVTTHGNYE